MEDCPPIKTEVNDEDVRSEEDGEEDDPFFNSTKADSSAASSSRESGGDDDNDDEDGEYTPQVKPAEFVLSKKRTTRTRRTTLSPEKVEKDHQEENGRGGRTPRSRKAPSRLDSFELEDKKKKGRELGRSRKQPPPPDNVDSEEEPQRKRKARKTPRSKMTPKQLEKVRIRERERMRMNRAQKTPEELEERRRKDRERTRLRRAKERAARGEDVKVGVQDEFSTPLAPVSKRKDDEGEGSSKIVVKSEPRSGSEAEDDEEATSTTPMRPQPRSSKQCDPIAREEYLRTQRELKRQSRARGTPEQIEARKQKEREYKRLLRARMTPEQKKEYSKRIQFRRFVKKAQMTEEELKQHKIAQYMKFVARKASMTPEELERDREKARIRARERARAHRPQTEEEKLKYRETLRNNRKNWPEERKQRVKEQMRQYFQRYKARVMSENPEKWEERKRKNKEYWETYRKSSTGRRKKEPKTEEEKRVRKFLVNRASTRRSQLKKRLTIQTLVEKGVRPEEIQKQMEPPEQREKRLLRTRFVKRKRLLRIKLVEQGLSPEEIQIRLDEFEANFETTKPVLPYKPRRFLSKPVDPAELEKLEATRKYRLTKHMKVIVAPESQPVPIVDAPWADPSKYGVSIPVVTKTVTFEPYPGGTSSSSGTRYVPATTPAFPSTSTAFSSLQQTQNHQYESPSFPFEAKPHIPNRANYETTPQSSSYNHYHHHNQHQQPHHLNYSHGQSQNNPQEENLYDAVSSLDDDGSCHYQDDENDDDYYEPSLPPPPQPGPSTSASSSHTAATRDEITAPPKRRGRGPGKKPKADSQSQSESYEKPTRRDKMFLRRSKRENADQICDLCGNFYTLNYIYDHKLFMHNPDYVKGTCVPCNIFFPTNRDYHSHWIHTHRVSQLKRDDGKPKTIICDVCGTGVASLNNLEKHKHFMHGKGSLPENYVKCPFCPTSLKSTNVLQRHIVTIHPGEGFKHCGRCEQRFNSIKKYNEHVKEAHPEAYFPCESCGLLKYSKSTLNFHYMQCRVRLREKGKEVKKENGEGEEEEKKQKKKVEDENAKPDHIYKQQAYRLSTLHCEVCELKVLITSLKRHYMNIHGILEEKFKCFHCEKLFSRREYWIMHSEEIHGVNIEDEERRKEFSKYNVEDRSKVVVKRPEGIRRGPRSEKEKRKRDRGEGRRRGRQKKIKKEVEKEEEEEKERISDGSEDREWISLKKKKKNKDGKALEKKRGRGRPKKKVKEEKEEDDDDEEEEEEEKSLLTVRLSVRGRRRRITRGACDFQNVERERRLAIVVERLSEEEIGKYQNQRANQKENVDVVFDENIVIKVE
ncbi:unnamed protein product [Orchesella dallaii]|uniref:C2H2-type domain-containing protein n=1 Tax=Orchesella dallaii TaxID=48710 RepID=A0ABP1RVA1_9HEXA